MSKYVIKTWIEVEVNPEDEQIYETRKEAELTTDHLEQMHPENVYEIVELEEPR